MEFLTSVLTEEAGTGGRRMGRRRADFDDTDVVYKSKNLQAERRRRQKLSDRLLALRATVPIITNMNKATIIEDAITYIQELQKQVKVLGDKLQEMEVVSSEGEAKPKDVEIEIDAAEEMKQSGIQEDAELTYITGNKAWVKMVLAKKKGRFTRLLEALAFHGFELTETSATTFKGAMLITSCIEVRHKPMYSSNTS
ncbi:hypothetical protein Tsubulata_015336 [Turnera subulata]|uniref:BHLH domain-containing protein n=1 Tax=Turnera subulata TaxID=218843 RepID=A0A9Q0FUF0_9ROSI|nr:hypothetical protein Tsubulata_015336 [Turnera subulata]